MGRVTHIVQLQFNSDVSPSTIQDVRKPRLPLIYGLSPQVCPTLLCRTDTI
jgi:hypothetical protein